MSGQEVEIGYLCDRGHYCFYADSDESGSCGSKRVARIVAISELDADESSHFHAALQDADEHLEEVIEGWRSA